MAIDLNMCEPNGSDLAGHGSHEIVLKLNAPINSQTVGNKELVETFFYLDDATYEHACRYEDCEQKSIGQHLNKYEVRLGAAAAT